MALKDLLNSVSSAVKASNSSKTTKPTKTTKTSSISTNEHADYINQTWSGGMDSYTKNQQERYNGALASGDTALINRLQADAQRVGYSLSGSAPKAVAVPRTSAPAPTPTAAQASIAGQASTNSPAANYKPTAPTYWTGDEMAKNLGIDYNYQNILNKLNNATKDEYALLNKEYGATENKFYNQMYGTQGTMLDTIRKSQAQAIATGASRGLQSANELSSMLGLQQETVASATDLAQQRNMLKDKEAGAYTKNVVDATNTYNTLGTTFGNLINNKYAADIQNNVGLMEYFKGLDQNFRNLQGTVYGADSNLQGTVYAADQNLAGVDLSSARNLEGQLGYNQVYSDAAKLQSDATRYAAEQNLLGTKYNANSYKNNYSGGGSYSGGAGTPQAGTDLIKGMESANNYIEFAAYGHSLGFSDEEIKMLWSDKLKVTSTAADNKARIHDPDTNSTRKVQPINPTLPTPSGYPEGSIGALLYKHKFINGK